MAKMIRRATSADLEGLKGLYAQLQREDPVVKDSIVKDHSDLSVFEQILDSEYFELFVLENSQAMVVATCYLNLIPNMTRGAAPYGIIENVVTDKASRNQGFGKRIITHALDVAWAAGCYKVMLQTGSKKPSTHRFYESCGFAAGEKFAFVARPAIPTETLRKLSR